MLFEVMRHLIASNDIARAGISAPAFTAR